MSCTLATPISKLGVGQCSYLGFISHPHYPGNAVNPPPPIPGDFPRYYTPIYLKNFGNSTPNQINPGNWMEIYCHYFTRNLCQKLKKNTPSHPVIISDIKCIWPPYFHFPGKTCRNPKKHPLLSISREKFSLDRWSKMTLFLWKSHRHMHPPT